ncbi:hypothetical protein CHS0354_006817 [Potamilus streckersoni]|uniref:Uncharacterized protein n=1 Tax=Potamilus streckersoni TaxID=2493646 RepID=A0AAE0WBR3_9BIVA|nr:hypothetical protein CHS0354_006817 [Potamilus streckersoni]
MHLHTYCEPYVRSVSFSVPDADNLCVYFSGTGGIQASPYGLMTSPELSASALPSEEIQTPGVWIRKFENARSVSVSSPGAFRLFHIFSGTAVVFPFGVSGDFTPPSALSFVKNITGKNTAGLTAASAHVPAAEVIKPSWAYIPKAWMDTNFDVIKNTSGPVYFSWNGETAGLSGGTHSREWVAGYADDVSAKRISAAFYKLELTLITMNITFVRLETDSCTNTFGTLPCTASGEPCYNTPGTCRDIAGLTAGTRDYYFVRYDLPPGNFPPLLDGKTVINLLESVSDKTTVTLRPEFDLGVRAGLTLSFTDRNGYDGYDDPYARPAAGSFWGRFLARNEYYRKRPLWVITADNSSGTWEYITAGYLTENITREGTGIKITAKDPLTALDKKIPAEKLKTKLTADLPAGNHNTPQDGSILSSYVTVPAESTQGFPDTGHIRIDDEIFRYTGKTASAFTGCYHILRGGTGAAHDRDTDITPCTLLSGHPADVICDILASAGDLSGYWSRADFEKEKGWGSYPPVSAVIAEPVKASELINELLAVCPLQMFWDEESQKIMLQAVTPARLNFLPYIIDDGAASGEVKITDPSDVQPAAGVHYNLRQWTDSPDDADSYENLYLIQDTSDPKAEGTNILKSRWLNGSSELTMSGICTRLLRRADKNRRTAVFQASAGLKKTVKPGGLCLLKTKQYTDTAGEPLTAVLRITAVKDVSEAVSRFTGIITDYSADARYAFIAADDTPPYEQASPQQKQANAFLTDDNGRLPDGSPGYLLV